MPGQATIRIYQGETKTYLVTHKSESGVVRDYSGCTFAANGKQAHSDTTTTWSLTTANGGIEYVTIDGVKKIKLKFTDELSATIPATTGVWDLFAFTPTGESIAILYGPYISQRRVPSPNV